MATKESMYGGRDVKLASTSPLGRAVDNAEGVLRGVS